MNQENAEKKSVSVSLKRIWKKHGNTLAALLLIAFIFAMTQRDRFPRNTMSLQGSIIILDENGEPIPYRNTGLIFYSRYDQGFFRSDDRRKRSLFIDESGFGTGTRVTGNRPIKVPNYPFTLFFYTRNGKYAAVVDIERNEPTTGLLVELRPRFSATGRLVDHTGTPLANHEFSLMFYRNPGFTVFEYEYCETDADGFFTANRLIPGLEYRLRIYLPRYVPQAGVVKMPILQPEQYQEPHNLGDVVVR